MTQIQEQPWQSVSPDVAEVEGAVPVISGIMTGAGGGAVVLVSKMPKPSIMAYTAPQPQQTDEFGNVLDQIQACISTASCNCQVQHQPHQQNATKRCRSCS